MKSESIRRRAAFSTKDWSDIFAVIARWGLKSLNPNIPALPKGIDFSGDASKPGYQVYLPVH